MSKWHEKYHDWEGTAEQLVDTIADVVGESPVPAHEFAPNVRLLRHYQSIGAVSRPERRGKEAIYSFRQLIEVMLVRHLILDGWPLSKIAPMAQGASDKELTRMLPDYHGEGRGSSNRAQRLVDKFAKEAMQVSTSKGRRRSQRIKNGTEKEAGAQAGQLEPSIGPGTGGVARRREMLDLDLTDWCRLTLDRGALGRLEREDIDRVADGIRRAIEQERLREKRSRRK